MLENIPTQAIMTELLGQPLFEVWQELWQLMKNTIWNDYEPY